MARYIEANDGRRYTVDDETYAWAFSFRWCTTDKKGKYFYAYRCARVANKKVKIYLHREVVDAEPGVFVDHVNGDTTDNRRENLRLSDCASNQWNSGVRVNNTSGYKGVTLEGGRWRARIRIRGRRINVGLFESAEEAHAAYLEAAKKHHGEFARY